MNKFIIFSFCFFSFTSCYRIPQQAEIEYRSRLENALVETFPKKLTVVIHPFDNLSKGDTNRAYLEQAIPDNIEAMLESLRSSLAYIPFDGMPFYVSSELSNLFQVVNAEDPNFDEFADKEEEKEDENEEKEDSIFDETDDKKEEYDRYEESYFSYLTNYLLVVPTQETQYNALTSTNTNYYDIKTNIVYKNAVPETNIVSNEILMTTTNEIKTNLIIVNKNLLTPTNMLLLLYEEFPELINYLSFLPIEVRRATEQDQKDFADYKLRLSNPTQWRKNQTNQDSIEAEYPSTPFEYIYNIGGSYQTRRADSLVGSVEVTVRMQIFPTYSSGDDWWQKKYQQTPPVLSEILALEKTLDPKDSQVYKDLLLRTPFTKPPISPRLQDSFETYSTNFRDTRPNVPENPLAKRTRPLSLRLNVQESEIPTAMQEWLKYFHAIIVNRPYTALRVTSEPTGALVYLNGVYVGSTPLVYPTAPLGEQRVMFLKDGFNREEILTDIVAGQTNSISYRMQALNQSGMIRVTASIPDAEVYVNSLYKGKTPLIVSNLTLHTKYRVEVLNPNANLVSNRNSVYKHLTLTEQKLSIDFDAQFKNYETKYRSPAQQGLLVATYISWFTTVALLGTSIYTQYRFRDTQNLVNQFGEPTTPVQVDQLNQYIVERDRFAIATQATLYSSIAAALISTGIMGWYLYSKEIYLGMDVRQDEWYAKFKWKF
ncbi:MAG: PEGA domain-containing protein [Brevinema sp.]